MGINEYMTTYNTPESMMLIHQDEHDHDDLEAAELGLAVLPVHEKYDATISRRRHIVNEITPSSEQQPEPFRSSYSSSCSFASTDTCDTMSVSSDEEQPEMFDYEETAKKEKTSPTVTGIKTSSTILSALHKHFLCPTDDATPQMRTEALELYFPLYVLYACSCLIFSISGIIIAYNHVTLTERLCGFWPWHVEGILLIPQGFISYMSDAHTLGLRSYWHPIDRCVAFFFFIANMVRIILMVQNGYFQPLPNPDSVWVLVSGAIIAIRCWKLSCSYCRSHEVQKMMLAHIGWHCFLPFGGLYVIFSVL